MGQVRILIVDGDRYIRDALTAILRRQGYEVLALGDGDAAFEHLRNHSVDVVLTDPLVPTLDGFRCLSSMRKEFPGLYIVAMSGLPPEYLPSAYHLGADEVLPKPFLLTDLVRVISHRAEIDPEGATG